DWLAGAGGRAPRRDERRARERDPGEVGAAADHRRRPVVRGAEGGRGREGSRVMAIWADKSTRVIVQGITGREGTFRAIQCRDYGTNVVGGVTPGKRGTTHEGFAVFNTVREAREQ